MQRLCMLLALAFGLSATLSYSIMFWQIHRQGGTAFCGEFYPSGLFRWIEWYMEPWILAIIVIVQGYAILYLGTSLLRSLVRRI